MNKNRIRILVLISIIVSTVFVLQYPVLGAKTTIEEKLQNAQKEKTDTQEKLQEAQGRIDSLQQSKSALSDYLQDLNNELSEISEVLSGIEENMYVKEEDVVSIDEEIAVLEKDIDKLVKELLVASEDMVYQYSAMKKRIKHIYMQGEESYLEALFNSTGYGNILNYPEYIKKANEYDNNILIKMKARRDEIENKKRMIEEKKFTIEKRKADKEQEQKEIEQLRQDSLLEQAKVEALIKKTSQDIEKYNDEIESAEAAADKYEEQILKKEQDINQLKKELERDKELSEKSKAMAKKDLTQISIGGGERDILAALIFCEAGNEPYEGKIAVGAVVMNRCMSGAFPNTITGVVYQKGQFSPAASGKLATRLMKGAPEECYRAADEAMSGTNNIGNALFFRRATSAIKGQVIGHHVFYN